MMGQGKFWRDVRWVTRLIGALLTIVGGAFIIFQAFLTDVLPLSDGFVRAGAIVTKIEQRGTFQEPTFAIILQYNVTNTDFGVIESLRSIRQVDFEAYSTLSEGDRVRINYNPLDPYEWRLMEDFDVNPMEDYAVGLLLILLGLLLLTLPTIIRLASREDDFRYPEV